MKATLPIPDCMKHLDIDRRGYPIPYGVHCDEDGTPNFVVNDEQRRQHAFANDLCHITGKKLHRGRWLVGGPLSAFHEQGSFIDGPAHGEAVHYALSVCPYLASPRYGKSVTDALGKKAKAKNANLVLAEEAIMLPDRPAYFLAVMGSRMEYTRQPEHLTHPAVAMLPIQQVRFKRPYIRVQLWQHGAMLVDATTKAKIKAIEDMLAMEGCLDDPQREGFTF